MPIPAMTYGATVPELLQHCRRAFGDADFVETPDERLTYADAERASRRLAKRLVAAGIAKGTRVGGHFPYGTAWLVAWLAVNRIGAVYVPLSTAYKPAELRKSLRHSDVHLLLAPRTMFGTDRQDFLEAAVPGLADGSDARLHLPAVPFLRAVWVEGGGDRAWATSVSFDDAAADDLFIDSIDDALLAELESEVKPADPAIVIYTSGSTSEPKGVVHTHGALVRKGHALAWYLGWTAADRVFCGMPFFWVGGIGMTVVPAMDVGAALLCVERTDPGPSLQLMEAGRATRMTGWPGVIGPIFAHPDMADCTFPARTAAILAPATPGARFVSSLGMTETLASHTLVGPDTPEIVIPDDATGACMGPAVEGVEHRIVDPETYEDVPEGQEGALLVRGYCVMQGIHKHEREATFTPDGWYNTGDRCYLRDGLLYLTGRLTEMIKTSGNNVAPPEVEGVLLSFADVGEAHVLGIPDDERGEIVAALVVPVPGGELDPEELIQRARAELSNYKVPRKIVVVAAHDVPWLPTGKPDRLKIREMIRDA